MKKTSSSEIFNSGLTFDWEMATALDEIPNRTAVLRGPSMTRDMATRIVELVLQRERDLLNGNAGRMTDENGVRNFAWNQIREQMIVEFPHYEFTVKVAHMFLDSLKKVQNIKRKWDNECASAKSKLAQLERNTELEGEAIIPQLNQSERMLVTRFQCSRKKSPGGIRGQDLITRQETVFVRIQ